jgi:hypothetical protein
VDAAASRPAVVEMAEAMSRAVWVDAGNDPDYAKLKANGIGAAYFDIRDPRVTPGYLSTVASRGLAPGVYAAWNWLPPPYTGAAVGAGFAEWLSEQVAKLGKHTPPNFPMVCADIETHDVAYILGFLYRWRQLRPHRVTDWTLEAFQGGLFSPLDTLKIAAADVGIAPGMYAGNMDPLNVVDVVLDLCAYSFPPGRIIGMYDAARLPAVWTGYAFTQGRLKP